MELGSVNKILVETCASKPFECSDEETASWVSTDSRRRTLLSMVVILVDGSKMVPNSRNPKDTMTKRDLELAQMHTKHSYIMVYIYIDGLKYLLS